MKTFVLGVGAQKAGTTWLHRYLGTSDTFAPGAMKEYHVWNAIYGLDGTEAPAQEGDGVAEREVLRAGLIARPELYFDHFEALLANPRATVTADITPAYSGLPAEAFLRVRTGFASRGIAVKVVFLMRDPVERCWSAARMYRRKQLYPFDVDPRLEESEFVRAYSVTPHARRRSTYERTIAAIEAAFEPEDIFYGFYETLFEPRTVEALSDFFGMSPAHAFTQREFNVSAKASGLPASARQAVARTYRQTLERCAERFPEVRRLWGSYSLLKDESRA